MEERRLLVEEVVEEVQDLLEGHLKAVCTFGVLTHMAEVDCLLWVLMSEKELLVVLAYQEEGHVTRKKPEHHLSDKPS